MDLHRVAKRYIHTEVSEELAVSEQVERLPQEIAENILALFHDYEERTSLEAKVARDADLLECIVQAIEYQVQGYADTQDWINNCSAGLQTATAKKLAEACIHTEPSAWWQGLKINSTLSHHTKEQ